MIPISQKMIIDTDTGVDDAIAIMMALASQETEILAITTVTGNTDVNQVNQNVPLLLDNLQKNIPIYPGAPLPLTGKKLSLFGLMGDDGLGNASRQMKKTNQNSLSSEYAALALTRIARETDTPFTLVALGPLTNLALACKLDPQFASNINKLVVMGGAIEAKGNASEVAEFNFLADPEAAAVVFNAGFADLWVVSWEMALNNLLLWQDYEAILAHPTKATKILELMTRHTIGILKDSMGLPGMPMADPVAMAVALQPEIVTKAPFVPASIETRGALGRGLIAIDWYNQTQKKPNAHVVTEINYQKFLELLEYSF